MPSIPFGTSAYSRARGGLPSLPVVNMVAEEAPTEESGIVLQSRPGLRDRQQNIGDGPVDGLFKRDLVLGTALFAVASRRLYKDGVVVGDIDGDGPVSMAGYGDFLFINAGSKLWGYDGTTLAPIAFPDNALVSRIVIGGSRLIAIRKDTGQFYWSKPLGQTIDALDFATAENQPDRLLDMLFLNGILLLFGSETVEYWPLGTDGDLPFQVLQGQVIQKGVRDVGCAVQIGSTFAWVTNESRVCLANEETIISNNGLQERIAASEKVSLWTFAMWGNEYVALRLDDETQVYNVQSKRWDEFKSYGFPNWVAQCYAGGAFGSAYDGRTMEWSDDWYDLGGVLERRIAAGQVINSGGTIISNISIRCNVGQTQEMTGDYQDPDIQMRLSRTGGLSWDDWQARKLGERGQFRQKVQWRGLGMASRPALFMEFMVTDPVDFRVSDVLVNEAYGGR